MPLTPIPLGGTMVPGMEEILEIKCIDTPPLPGGATPPQTPHFQSASGLQKGFLCVYIAQIINF